MWSRLMNQNLLSLKWVWYTAYYESSNIRFLFYLHQKLNNNRYARNKLPQEKRYLSFTRHQLLLQLVVLLLWFLILRFMLLDLYWFLIPRLLYCFVIVCCFCYYLSFFVLLLRFFQDCFSLSRGFIRNKLSIPILLDKNC